MSQPRIIGAVEPWKKARLDWIQEYIDWLWARYDPLPDDVMSEIAALYDKKIRLVEELPV